MTRHCSGGTRLALFVALLLGKLFGLDRLTSRLHGRRSCSAARVL